MKMKCGRGWPGSFRRSTIASRAMMHGQKVVTKMEVDLATRKSIVSFQPEHLPRIDSMTFVGTREMTGDQARAVMQKVTADRGYTDRQFRSLLENNLRPAYEERG